MEMRREIGSEDQAARPTRSGWSFGYIIVLPFVSCLFLCTVDRGSLFGFPALLLCMIILISLYMILLTVNLVMGRFLRAFSILFGLALGILLLWNGPIILGWARGMEFSHERPEFDEMVRLERARKPTPEAIRMVVKIEDRSMISISNSFYYIIYDETDEAIRAPDSVRGYWRYPKSETGVINVGGDKEIQHLSGHYYSFWTGD